MGNEMLVHHFVVIVDVAEPTVQPHDENEVDLVRVHGLHHLHEGGAAVKLLAGGDALIHIDIFQTHMMFRGPAAYLGLLRLQREAAQRLLGCGDTDIPCGTDNGSAHSDTSCSGAAAPHICWQG